MERIILLRCAQNSRNGIYITRFFHGCGQRHSLQHIQIEVFTEIAAEHIRDLLGRHYLIEYVGRVHTTGLFLVDEEQMEIMPEQYTKIETSLPVQRGNLRFYNLQMLNAIHYVAEHGCKWRGLPKRFGNWHSIYLRMNRCAKNGVLDRVFGQLHLQQIVRIRIEAFSLESTSVKVHPDGTGALKK